MMLVNICDALAMGLMQPWIPEPPPKESASQSTSPLPGEKSPSKSKGKSVAAASKTKTPFAPTVSPDAMPELKKAIEVSRTIRVKTLKSIYSLPAAI